MRERRRLDRVADPVPWQGTRTGSLPSEHGDSPGQALPGRLLSDPGGGRAGGESGLPSISLPKGGGAIRGIDEKLTVGQATGAATLTVPVSTSPARQGFAPQLAPDLRLRRRQRPVRPGLEAVGPVDHPQDLQGPAAVRRCGRLRRVHPVRRRGPGPAARAVGRRLERRRVDRDVRAGELRRTPVPAAGGGGIRPDRAVAATPPPATSTGGRSPATTSPACTARTTPAAIADPARPARIFSWLLDLSFDDRGNAISYEYKAEDSANVARVGP